MGKCILSRRNRINKVYASLRKDGHSDFTR